MTALVRCQTNYPNTGANLVSIHSREENEFVFGLTGRDPKHEIWLGGMMFNGQFTWADGTPFDYEQWLAGEPNNYKGVEMCLRMNHYKIGFAGSWNDARCNQRRPYVCKRFIGEETTTTTVTTEPETTTTTFTSTSDTTSSSTSSFTTSTTDASSTTTTTTTRIVKVPRCVRKRNWLPFRVDGETCYYRQFTTPRLTWLEADAECTACAEAQLASIHNDDENEFVSFTFPADRSRPRWIGGFRDKSGDFSWTDGSTFDYTNFAVGEPNNLGGREFCLAQGHTSFQPTEWNDANCRNTARFVCKWCPSYTRVDTTPFSTTNTESETTSASTSASTTSTSSTSTSSTETSTSTSTSTSFSSTTTSTTTTTTSTTSSTSTTSTSSTTPTLSPTTSASTSTVQTTSTSTEPSTSTSSTSSTSTGSSTSTSSTSTSSSSTTTSSTTTTTTVTTSTSSSSTTF